MSDFDRAVDIVLDLEGGEREVVDTGGFTKWGISQRAYPSLDIAALTRQDAIDIYERDYWNASGADRLPWPLSLCVFDAAVNQGVDPAIRMLQKALGGLRIDGIIGRKTFARVAATPPEEAVALYMAQRALRYVGTRAFDRYGRGWFARLFRIVTQINL